MADWSLTSGLLLRPSARSNAGYEDDWGDTKPKKLGNSVRGLLLDRPSLHSPKLDAFWDPSLQTSKFKQLHLAVIACMPRSGSRCQEGRRKRSPPDNSAAPKVQATHACPWHLNDQW